MIEVELPDGTVVEFPAGTDHAVIERVLAQQVPAGGPPPEVPAAAQPPITDLPAVRAMIAPEDRPDDYWSFPERPNSGLIDYARTVRPELADVPDQTLAAAIRQTAYPDMPVDEFYRQSGYDERFGYDTSVPSALDGMPGWQRAIAGLGKSFSDTGHGLAQLATEGAQGVAELYSPMIGEAPAGLLGAVVQRQREAADDRAQRDRDLVNTGAGAAGYVGGLLAPLGAGGYLSRGTRAASAVMPQRFAGNVAQGAAIGAAQPAGTEDSRAVNASVGALAGGGGYAALAVPGTVARQVGRFSPAITRGMQQRDAARVISEFASDPDAVRAAAANPEILVPGSMPTLAEASGDVGLAGLQRTLANMPDFGSELALRQQANNAARARAIEAGFGGADDATAAGIRQQANARAGRMLRPVEQAPIGADALKTLDGTIGAMLERHRAKPAVRSALQDVRDELANVQTVGDAHGVRQYIGHLMGGNIEGKASGKLAQRELATVRGVLDRQMREAFPEWGDFLRGHREAMRKADQTTIGADLLASGRAVRDATNDPVLQPASFARAANRIERPQNRSQRLRAAALTDEQRQTIESVRRDLERQARAQTDGKAIGSNTIQNAIGGNTLQSAVGPVGAAVVEPVSGVAMLGINQLRRTYGNRTMDIVQEVMLDPARAEEVLGSVPSRQRRAVMSAIRQLPSASGLAGRASAPAVVAGE